MSPSTIHSLLNTPEKKSTGRTPLAWLYYNQNMKDCISYFLKTYGNEMDWSLKDGDNYNYIHYSTMYYSPPPSEEKEKEKGKGKGKGRGEGVKWVKMVLEAMGKELRSKLINEKSKFGDTPLLAVVARRNDEMIKFITKYFGKEVDLTITVTFSSCFFCFFCFAL